MMIKEGFVRCDGLEAAILKESIVRVDEITYCTMYVLL